MKATWITGKKFEERKRKLIHTREREKSTQFKTRHVTLVPIDYLTLEWMFYRSILDYVIGLDGEKMYEAL